MSRIKSILQSMRGKDEEDSVKTDSDAEQDESLEEQKKGSPLKLNQRKSKNTSKEQTKHRKFEDVAEKSEGEENDSEHGNPLRTIDKRNQKEMMKLSLELRKSLQKLDALQKSIDAQNKPKVAESPDITTPKGAKKQNISQAEDSWFDTKNQQANTGLQSEGEDKESPLNKLNTHIQDVLKRKSENLEQRKSKEKQKLQTQNTAEILREPAVQRSPLDPEVQNSIEEALRNADIHDPHFDKKKIEEAIDELRSS